MKLKKIFSLIGITDIQKKNENSIWGSQEKLCRSKFRVCGNSLICQRNNQTLPLRTKWLQVWQLTLG